MASDRRPGLAPAQAVVVGDSIWDCIAAQRGGMLAIGLRSGGTSPLDLTQAGARWVYADPAELAAHLDTLGLAAAA